MDDQSINPIEQLFSLIMQREHEHLQTDHIFADLVDPNGVTNIDEGTYM